uniref:Aldehyde dehydrogenase domain-containing protein n=1 Tax=Chromera velia CCMP2878 TaxID=1169474 RepID=A0A0G4I8P1_9ALVE|mmetsp:Transcript_11041/g.21315  ORF Transcript_11041/g.21315 Transcript_11041/m.21315 type:complete len:579 (+) Transcript_11041:114-1850(+)|eukprot:Cvel_11908.t1-p1 / transcript=Cvel_11908.t1 / gene=Cvel_11908 / organism=Chromera_velia_CCMP2878 / gene_product=hypothetical protein / transcript_product=hypothetical protein / location=Cvel_scaffold762:37076-46812(+) / protein_length=578 / sequence_SO=supercontig / SO=protein_coding / is_pseudo=false
MAHGGGLQSALADVERVASNADRWRKLPPSEKVLILDEICDRFRAVEKDFVASAMVGRGTEWGAPGHDYMAGSTYVMTAVPFCNWLSELRRLFAYLDKHNGEMPKPQKIIKRENGGTAVKVGPADNFIWLFFGFPSCELHLPPGQKVEKQMSPCEGDGGVVAVLGAGNYETPVDVMTALFVKNKVAIYKPNPVTQSSNAILGLILKPLTDRNFLAITGASTEVASALVRHPKVTDVYITGSAMTYNRIVWGAPEAPSDWMEKKPLVEKPVVAELGGNAPVIVTPSLWGPIETTLQAQHLAVFSTLNGGHVCARPQTIVTCKNWAQRERFLQTLKKTLSGGAAITTYYPGTPEKIQAFASILKKEGKKEEEIFLKEPNSTAVFPSRTPSIFCTDVGTESETLNMEAFCPVLTEVCLDTEPTAEAFLPVATKFVNEKLTGNLAATIVWKDNSKEKPIVETAVDTLKHGAVGVNVNAGNVMVYPELFWGAGRGSTKGDVKSGIGKFGNIFGIVNAQKAVVRAPFYNPAVLAQRAAVPSTATKVLRIFRRLALALLARARNFGVTRWLFWAAALSCALVLGL